MITGVSVEEKGPFVGSIQKSSKYHGRAIKIRFAVRSMSLNNKLPDRRSFLLSKGPWYSGDYF